MLLRIEDHDATRSREIYDRAILEDLDWLGFVPDAPPARQSERASLYEHALARLEALGLVYPCACSRKALEPPVSPSPDGEPRHPDSCRERGTSPEFTPARRLRLERTPIEFDDWRLGRNVQNPGEQIGDLLCRDRNGHWTYQFAVVVDDMEQGVDLVIRGEDLLGSTGRQIQTAQLLGRAVPPRFLHHPLILRPDGRKLSKSEGDASVRDLRRAGWTIERILGEAAAAIGVGTGGPLRQRDVAEVVGGQWC